MNEIKRHWLVVPAAVIGVACVATLLALCTAQASPIERIAGSVPTILGVANPTAVIDSKASEPSQSTITNLALPPAISQPEPVIAPPLAPPVESEGMRALNSPRQFALGMIETGNDDSAIGEAGEVSRYQIMPSVWKHYSDTRRYRDPESSLEVAQLHWASLYDYFKKQARREPTDFDMYVLWNTRYGYYASRGFVAARLGAVVRDRANRFSNLVEEGARREAEITTLGRRG